MNFFTFLYFVEEIVRMWLKWWINGMEHIVYILSLSLCF